MKQQLYLEDGDEEEEENHVYDAIDDHLLYSDEQEDDSAGKDPVFAHYLHQEVPCLNTC